MYDGNIPDGNIKSLLFGRRSAVRFDPLDLPRLDTLPQQRSRGAPPCGKRRFNRNAFHADAPWMGASRHALIHPAKILYGYTVSA
ncbi:hypothetical protein [Paraburkholderia lacunae]|uniref:hypothetical protein n=1 Tax=Paraburkholderia lacunae TaxID=2211104 RepID=UPI001FCA88A2|nr:hypothetical protein [Paraburkholderia lacunae]